MGDRETVTCPHCGAANDAEAVEHHGVCHDCRGKIR
jgi:NMD protein affecting ribosome stability and mRNA decay